MKNLFIKNKKAITFGEDYTRIFADEVSKVEQVYTSLYCEELRNITFIIKGEEISQLTFVFETTEKFSSALQEMQRTYPELEFVQQNKKINGYAAAIAAKLREGIETGIVESSEQVSVKSCPMCGMECDPNIPYCMECGAEV